MLFWEMEVAIKGWVFHILDFFQRTFSYRILLAFADMLWLVLPFFISGILVSALIARYFPRLEKLSIFRRDGFVAIAVASLLGVFSPLATYLAVPFGALLIGMGFAVAPVLSFVVASPLMNPNLFILTAGVLGINMALARTVSAWLLGVIAGLLYLYLARRRVPLLDGKSDLQVPQKSQRTYRAEVWAQCKFVSKYLFISLLISAMVRVLVPAEWIAKALGAHASLSVLIAVALGVPLYSCGGAAIPIMRVLVDMGMTQGAVLAFFISGPATKLSTIYVFKAAMGSRMLAFYLIITLIGAILFGYIYEWM